MAHQTGSSSGTTDILNKLNVFAVAAGWTLNRRDGTSLSISKGAVFQNFFEDGITIQMSASTGYNAGNAWNAQPGLSGTEQQSNNLVGSFTAYHFFAAQDYIHVVIEYDPGLYHHLLFGQLKKGGAYTGGHYSLAEFDHPTLGNTASTELFGQDLLVSGIKAGAISVQVDALPSVWHSLSTTLLNRRIRTNCPFNGLKRYPLIGSASGQRYGYSNSAYELWAAQPNSFNSVSIPIPPKFYVERASSIYSPIGSMYDCGFVNMISFIPGSSITIGVDTWYVFPLRQKNVADQDIYSGVRGVAYRVI